MDWEDHHPAHVHAVLLVQASVPVPDFTRILFAVGSFIAPLLGASLYLSHQCSQNKDIVTVVRTVYPRLG